MCLVGSVAASRCSAHRANLWRRVHELRVAEDRGAGGCEAGAHGARRSCRAGGHAVAQSDTSRGHGWPRHSAKPRSGSAHCASKCFARTLCPYSVVLAVSPGAVRGMLLYSRLGQEQPNEFLSATSLQMTAAMCKPWLLRSIFFAFPSSPFSLFFPSSPFSSLFPSFTPQ